MFKFNNPITYTGCISQNAITKLFSISVGTSWFGDDGFFHNGIDSHYADGIATLEEAVGKLTGWFPGMRFTHAHPKQGVLNPPVCGISAFYYFLCAPKPVSTKALSLSEMLKLIDGLNVNVGIK